MIKVFPPQFHHLIFNFLRIEFHDFSRLSASSLMTRDISLKNLIPIFLKGFIILFIFNQIIPVI
jgi:hypothetical protein